MRPVRALVIYFVAVFVGGALVAPWLYFLTLAVAPGSALARHPFHRFLDRSLLGIALLGLWPLLRGCGIGSWREAGVDNIKPHRKELGRGMMIGTASLFFVFALSIMCGGRTLVFGMKNGWSALAGATTTAIIVSILEELLFRGGLFGLLRKALDWRVAMLVSSVVYALVHFLQKADLPGPVTWKSGLELLGMMFGNLADPHLLIPAFFNLTVVGCALAIAYQRTGALYGSIGLHGSWIFCVKYFQFLSRPSAGAAVWWWGGDNVLNGWLALPVLMLAMLAVARWTPAKL